MQACGKMSLFRDKFLRTEKEERDPRIPLVLEQLGVTALPEGIFLLHWSHLCFPVPTDTASDKGHPEGPGGRFLASASGVKGATAVKQLQEEVFERGPVSWVASQL